MDGGEGGAKWRVSAQAAAALAARRVQRRRG